jgi:hypothetical protein
MGRATPEDPPGTRMSPRWERALWLLKLALVIGIAWNVYRSYGGRPSASAHVHELYGTWDVDSFVLDGGERPPLLTDTDRWRAISANPQYLLIWPMTGEREALSLMVDAAAHTITVKLDDDTKDKDRLKEQEAKQKADEADKDKEEDKDKETWKYQRPAPDQLLIDGTHRGKVFHVALHLRPPPLLVTRGFHWINDRPFNQ